ncbi:hypothetical protein VUR80DRAFT_5907 [Thermomyces stellatus]
MAVDATRKASLEKECQTLRADLKGWEHQWSSEHGGTKPSRNDIKANPEIAKKYKEYNRLRDVLSGKVKDEPPKRKATEPIHTPVKRAKHKTVPGIHEPVAPDLSTPSADKTAPSPAPPTSIGPTPHRDGKVLGLFAFLDETPQKTPSKRPAADAVMETPSKVKQEDVEDLKLGRTPSSASKRRYLDTLVTPLKPTDGNAQPRTPVSVSKLQFGTPSFLRRRPLAAVEEMPEYQSPEKLRRTSRKPFARGLSAIVANLRKVEESAFDDDEEAMREMEAGEAPEESIVRPPASPTAARAPEPPVPDSQVVPETQPGMKMLGGFDDEAAYDSPVEEATDRGQPMKEFKKKGQKRTTRMVKMKPTIVKRPLEEVPAGVSDEDEVIPETQVDATAAGGSSDLEDGDYEGTATKEVDKRKREGEGDEKEGKVRKAARKVNELAHANFRRLKLRGKGAKGGGGGRFRRR